jgi:N-carbamoyl-L-amino-acid hydrolase
MAEAGLEVSRDETGNLFGRRGDARVWTGSHLDSVPNGGRYDGVLGVLAGIEASARLPEAELAVVVFRAEETGPMGSRAFGRAAGGVRGAAHRAGGRCSSAPARLWAW